MRDGLCDISQDAEDSTRIGRSESRGMGENIISFNASTLLTVTLYSRSNYTNNLPVHTPADLPLLCRNPCMYPSVAHHIST